MTKSSGVLRFIFLLLVIISRLNFGQENEMSLNGFVYDASNGEPLIGANVYIKSAGFGASTNLNGYFVIPRIQSGKYDLTVSYIGYQTHNETIEIRSGKNLRIDFRLSPQAVQGETVVVTADSMQTIDKLFNKPVSKLELSPAQISKIPQVIEADLLRTLQTLPGIVPLSDFSSAIYVRGGTPDQNLFLLDGTDVYNPEHAFGLFSTFNTDAIKKVEVYKGGFGAEYGGRLSSVVNITNNDGNRNNFEGKASLSLLSLSATLQSPLGDFGSLLGSIRRTYLDQTLAKVIDDIPDYYFLDGNLKATFDLSEKNKLSVSIYGGVDNLNFVLDKSRPESLGFDYVWGNQTGSVNWRTILAPTLFGNFWITYSGFFSDFDFKTVQLSEKNNINDLTFKGALEYFYSEKWSFKFGFEQKNVHGGLKQSFQGARVDAARGIRQYSLYYTTTWKPDPLWEVEGGLRADYFDSRADYKNLDPRFSVKYKLTESSNLKFSGGTFHQYANRVPRLFFVSIWTAADEYIKGSSSDHAVFGYQKVLSSNFQFEAEVYYKTYRNIYSYNQNVFADVKADYYDENNFPVYTSSRGLYNRGDGNSAGIELLLRKESGAITGWLAYAFSKTEYTVDGINKGREFPPRHDRTHAVNLITNIDLNNILNELHDRQFTDSDKKWSLGFNFTFFSGQPITLPSSIYTTATLPDWSGDENNIAIYPTEINKYSLPSYMRLDFSVNYEIRYDGWTLSPYLQIFNVLNRKNVWFIQYENKVEKNTITQKIENVNMLPILPSIGVSIKF